MLSFIQLLTSTLIPLLTAWQVQTYGVDFSIKHGVGGRANGSLKGLDVNIQFDESHPELTDISATVLTSTITTGLAIRDSKIKGEDYLDVVRFPKISLRINGAALVAPGLYRSVGILQIKGKAQQIPLTFSYVKQPSAKNQPGAKPSAKFNTRFTINRLDFGVGSSSWILADSLSVSVGVVANVP